MKDIDLINMMGDFQVSSDTGWQIDNQWGIISRELETTRELTKEELRLLSNWFKAGLSKDGTISYRALGTKLVRWIVPPKYQFSFIEEKKTLIKTHEF